MQMSTGFGGRTVITTFETTPGRCADLMEALQLACGQVVRHRPGLAAAALHGNDAQSRIAGCGQWRRREDFMAIVRTPEMRERNRQFSALCARFEPVMPKASGVVPAR